MFKRRHHQCIARLLQAFRTSAAQLDDQGYLISCMRKMQMDETLARKIQVTLSKALEKQR